jgi:hypothetical protein
LFLGRRHHHQHLYRFSLVGHNFHFRPVLQDFTLANQRCGSDSEKRQSCLHFDDHKHMNLVPFCTAIELLSKKFRLCPKNTFSSSSSYVLHQKCHHCSSISYFTSHNTQYHSDAHCRSTRKFISPRFKKM